MDETLMVILCGPWMVFWCYLITLPIWIMGRTEEGREKLKKQKLDYYKFKKFAKWFAIIVVVVFLLIPVVAPLFNSHSGRCIYCDEYFGGSGNTCGSCSDWINDAQDAIEDYRGY